MDLHAENIERRREGKVRLSKLNEILKLGDCALAGEGVFSTVSSACTRNGIIGEYNSHGARANYGR